MSNAAAAIPSVLIVGAGPVGLTMALALTEQGVPCRIVDRAAAPTDKSKALVLWGRTLENLESIAGLNADFLAAGMWATGANMNGNGKRLVQFTFDRADTAYPQPLMLPQCDTERILTHHLLKRGVVVQRQTELISCVELPASAGPDAGSTPTPVQAVLRGVDGHEETVETPWLIGCDGSHSTVRKQLGMQFSGDFEPNDWMLADIHLDGPVAPREISIYWNSHGLAAFFPIGHDRFRFIADIGKAPGSGKPADPTLEQVQAALDSRGLSAVRVRDPIWLAGFRIHERKVEHYGHGRMFLAGDAAHIHSPAGGQGMNTGMQDACNLAWKLAFVCHGWARPAPLLPSYSDERSEIGEMVLRNASRLTTVATLHSPILQFVRNHVALLAGKLSSVQQRFMADLTELSIHYPHSVLNGDDPGEAWSGAIKPGDRLPDALLLKAGSGEEVRLLAVLAEFRYELLLLPGANDLGTISSMAEGARRIQRRFAGVRARWILPAGSQPAAVSAAEASEPLPILIDAQGQLAERFGLQNPAIALVRPDGYLAMRGNANSWLAIFSLLANSQVVRSAE